MTKYEAAKEIYEKAKKKKLQKDAEDKMEAYNAWRAGEEKKGRLQDEHGRNLVKAMLESVKLAQSEPVTSSMCNVIGNVDGKLFCNNDRPFFPSFFVVVFSTISIIIQET